MVMSKNTNDKQHRAILQGIASRAMFDRGLFSDFSAEALMELAMIHAPATMNNEPARDLRDLLWASLGNDDAGGLDQLTVAETMPGDKVKIFVAVADVDSLVTKGSAIDEYACHNTTSVYTPARIFPMLPEKFFTNLTSLKINEDRLAIVVEMKIGGNGALQDFDIYRAWVRNHAKLNCNSVAAWLEGSRYAPDDITAIFGLAENLRLQNRIAQNMKNFRYAHEALSLETIEERPIFDGDEISELEVAKLNRAQEMIEDFVIAVNSATIRYLRAKKFPSIRRVIRTPKRWEKIVEIAGERGFKLPDNPESAHGCARTRIMLEEFLVKEKAAAPLRFPALSLTIVKLLGASEYVIEIPGEAAPGHFGLAAGECIHSTTPNHRYSTLITQRLLKAAIAGYSLPYENDELKELARHCAKQENAANKVERQVKKSAAALLMELQIELRFDAIVTGASGKGVWVRLFHPPIEGRLVSGFEGLDVGDRVRVELVDAEVKRGYIDFTRVITPGAKHINFQ
ncbi:MAG TPA: RNB domain-containing ribonuclease [Bacillota bacterium]|nr:RNB domain-containing ribonuclease [Bacillota bacterium]